MLFGGVKYINYIGPKYGKEKETYFENADIFVFPTFYNNECFPLVLLEAMQYKLPIATTDEGGIPDIVQTGVNGIVCKRKDAVSLSTAIEKLLTDKEKRTTLGNKGYEIYSNHYTLQHFKKAITEILLSQTN